MQVNPELLILVVTGLLGYTGLASPLFGVRVARYSAILSTLLSIFAGIYLTMLAAERGFIELFDGNIFVDYTGAYLLTIASLTLLLDLYAAKPVVDRWDTGSAFYAITSLNLLGVYAVALAGSLVNIYAAWILAAVSSYVIIALWKNEISAEASGKYAVMGVVATSMLIYTLALETIVHRGIYLSTVAHPGSLVVLGAAILLPLAAVGFKMGVVPFHMWLPDVYGNARPFLVSVIASQAKILAVAFLLKLLAPIVTLDPPLVTLLAGILAAATMTLGNLAALASNDLRKMMAYSAIGQAGYLLAGIAALVPATYDVALRGILLQVFGYALAKSSIFLILDALYEGRWREESLNVADGLVSSNPVAAVALALALATLLGVPPTLGFWGKLLILLALVKVSALLAIVFAVNIAISAFYYGMVMWKTLTPSTARVECPLDERSIAALAASMLSLLLGLFLPAL